MGDGSDKNITAMSLLMQITFSFITFPKQKSALILVTNF